MTELGVDLWPKGGKFHSYLLMIIGGDLILVYINVINKVLINA